LVRNVVESLGQIGCPSCAAITQRAIGALAIEGELTQAAIEVALADGSDEMLERLGACDSEYYANDEDLAGRLFEFVKRHRDEVRVA
jgi:hypothetical protein